jgi:hypothetical protein
MAGSAPITLTLVSRRSRYRAGALQAGVLADALTHHGRQDCGILCEAPTTTATSPITLKPR